MAKLELYFSVTESISADAAGHAVSRRAIVIGIWDTENWDFITRRMWSDPDEVQMGKARLLQYRLKSDSMLRDFRLELAKTDITIIAQGEEV